VKATSIDRVHIQDLQAEWHELNLISVNWHRGGIDSVHMQRSQHGSEDSEASSLESQ